ncbi:MAG: PEP-CTERM sorting domain-containing protein [Pirellulaceae bacterium]|nr:PEP-CTERM sorting domain-containing protein [Pirellulaceae bacterium]
MLRRLSSLCAFMLAIGLAAGTADAALLLYVSAPPQNPVLNPGDEITLTIRIRPTSLNPDPDDPDNNPPLQSFNGGDFMIGAGGGGTFELATVPANNPIGGWTAVPAQGGVERFYTGGPANTVNFFNTNPATGRNMAFIVLKAGNVGGQFTTTFTQVNMLDAAFNVIPTSIEGFTYTVNAIPEPSSALLCGLGVGGLALRRRRS